MTLLFFDGFQDAILVPKPEWSTSTVWAVTQTGRDSQAVGAAGNGTRDLVLPSSAATCICGVAINFAGAAGIGNAGNVPMAFCSALGTIQTLLFVNATGFIEARRTTTGGTLLGTSSGHPPIQAGAWYHIAAKCVLNSAGAGSIVVQLNGIQVLNLTAQTTSSVTQSVTHIRLTSATSGNIMYFDDMYVCDAVSATGTQGQANNDFLGDVTVKTLLPSAAGDTTQWTPSTGSNFAAVDETPPNTTDYVSDTVSGHRDLYNLFDTSGTFTTVYGVREGIYVQKVDSGSIQVKPVIKENATVTSDSAQAPTIGFTSIWGTARYVKPSNSGLWAQADLDALQIGVEVA